MEHAAESISWLRSDHIAGVEILTGKADARPWRWFHETYSFCAAKAAASDWRYRSGEYFLKDGSVMLLEPGEMHRNCVVHKPADFKVVLISPNIFAELTKELGIPAAVHFSTAQIDSPNMFATIWQLCAAVEAGATALAQQEFLARAVSHLASHAERRRSLATDIREPLAVAKARAYLEDHYREPVTLDKLTEVAGVNRFHLVRAFTRTVGMPPHTWQILLRIERSRALLAEGMPPTIAATYVGFYDQAHFTRHFKRIMRITPGDYARGVHDLHSRPSMFRTPQ